MFSFLSRLSVQIPMLKYITCRQSKSIKTAHTDSRKNTDHSAYTDNRKFTDHSANTGNRKFTDHSAYTDNRKKVIRCLILLLTPLLFLFLFCALQPSLPDIFLTEKQRFSNFTENIFRQEMTGNTLSLNYAIADPSAYEIDRSRISLGNADLSSRQKSRVILENYLSGLQNFDRSKLSASQQLTYDVFSHYLKTELSASHLLLYDEPLSPTLGIQAQLPILFAEYNFRTKRDIEDYLCLLTQVPDYFASILAFEQEKSKAGLFMSEDCALDVMRQCREFISDPESNYLIAVFNEKIDRISNLTVDEKIAYKSRNKSILLGYVIPAYQSCLDELGILCHTGSNDKGLYYFPQGQEYYRYLLKSMTGDDRDVAEIEEEIKKQLVEDYTSIQKLLTQYNRQTDSANTLNGSGNLSDPADILDELRRKIMNDFPLLPAVSCEVKYVHESLQKHLSPAFYLTPAIDDYKNNVIYINPSGNYNALDLYTTLAHEGYPGHLYQSVFFQAANPDLLRTILDVGGYTEGWATYVEMYSYSLWEGDPIQAVLGQKNRSFTLGLASLLDIGIHYRGYSLEEVSAFLEKLGFDSEMADSLYRNILHAPANYLQYYVGYLNFMRLRNQMQEKLGEKFSLKEFHQAILEAGPMPFALLEKQLSRTIVKSSDSDCSGLL